MNGEIRRRASLWMIVGAAMLGQACGGEERELERSATLTIGVEYEVIFISANNIVENYHLWFKGADLSETALKRFADTFAMEVCTKQCNLSIYDRKLDAQLATKYPLRGAEYVEVADHLVAHRTFDSGGFLAMWPLKKDSAYGEAKRAAASTR